MKRITRCAAIVAAAAITIAAGAAEARDHWRPWGYGLPTPIYDAPVFYVQQPRYYAAPPVYGVPQQPFYGRVTFRECKQQLEFDAQAWERDRQANGGVPLGPRPNQLRCADYPIN